MRSPFGTDPRRQVKDLSAFVGLHVERLGLRRGLLAAAETLVRFARLRWQLGAGPAPMVDDAVCFVVAAHQSLGRRIGPTESLELLEERVVATGGEMMAGWVPADRTMSSLGRRLVEIMDDAQDRGVYAIEGMATSDEAMSWDVTACRYSELTKRFGHPEVGRLFCAVDVPFVSGVLPEVDFSSETTIARGDDRCRFRVGSAVPVELRNR